MHLFSFLLFLALGGGEQAATGSVEGIVLRTGTTDPVSRAEVTLTREGQAPTSTLTDQEGRFSFGSLAPGTYAIRIQRDGYFGVDASGSVGRIQLRLLDLLATDAGNVLQDRLPTTPATATIDVTASQRRTGLEYYLTPGGILTGQVLNNARPFPGAIVTALRLDYRYSQRSFTPVKSAVSDDRGEFRISWLEAGEYFVRADATLPDGKGRSYFPGTSSPEQALKVRIGEGVESTRINIPIDANTVTLSGAVANMSIVVPRSPDTQRTARFLLIPVDQDGILDGSADVENSVTDLADRFAGKFEIQAVRPGTYDLVAIFSERLAGVPVSPRFPVYAGRTRIVAGGADVRGIAIRVSPGGDLHGRLTNMQNAALPAENSYRVGLLPTRMLPANLAPNLTVDVLPAGTFTIPAVPELSYWVAVRGLSGDTYIADILQNGRSIFDTGTLDISNPSTNVEIVLNSPGAVVAGRVSALSKPLPSGVSVVLAPFEQSANRMLYRRIAVSSSGAFSVGGVVPGRYRLFAFENLPETAEFDRAFLESVRERGVEITAASGYTTTAEIGLIPK